MRAVFDRHAPHGFMVLDGHGNAVQRADGVSLGKRAVGLCRGLHRLLRRQMRKRIQLRLERGDPLQHRRCNFDRG